MIKAKTPWPLAVTSAAASVLLLAGCAGTATEPSGAPEAAEDWQAGAPAEWAEILKAGQEEGQIVLDSSPELLQSGEFAAAFERDTGIQIISAAGESGSRYTAMEQEAQASQLSVDVSLGGGSELRMVDQGLLNDMKSQLLLPGVLDPENWKGGGITWMDEEGMYMLRASNYVFGWVAVNTDKYDIEDFETWEDLLDPALKGRIATYDPLSGPGQATSAFLYDILGEDYIKSLYIDQEPTVTTDRRQLIEWVARGTYDLALGGTQAEVERFAREGLPITGMMPKDGVGQLSGGSGVLKQPKNADGTLSPNPNAAQVFINWYASQPGQQAYDNAMLEVTTRTDVDLSDIPEYVQPEADREYVDTYEEHWYTVVRSEVAAKLRALFGR